VSTQRRNLLPCGPLIPGWCRRTQMREKREVWMSMEKKALGKGRDQERNQNFSKFRRTRVDSNQHNIKKKQTNKREKKRGQKGIARTNTTKAVDLSKESETSKRHSDNEQNAVNKQTQSTQTNKRQANKQKTVQRSHSDRSVLVADCHRSTVRAVRSSCEVCHTVLDRNFVLRRSVGPVDPSQHLQ
jgi:hypothetical protein